MKKWIPRIIFIAGFLMLLYPLVSGLIQRQYQQRAVATYQTGVEDRGEEEQNQMVAGAQAYNSMLYQSAGAVVDNMDTGILSDESYNSLLNQSNGIMGSIEIPKIDVDLPIYHGTSDEVLSNGVGHVQGTSLPVGGENTHCCLSGHRGLPGSRLFTRLDEMKEGDLFFLSVMGEVLAYRVCRIETVDPDNTEVMEITAGRDEVSLITCTPYGLNTHRLVVTGERVAYEKAAYGSIRAELPSIRELIFTAAPFVLVLIAAVIKFVDWRKRKNEKRKKSQHVSAGIDGTDGSGRDSGSGGGNGHDGERAGYK